MKFEELKPMEGKYCLLVLENGFHYEGFVKVIYDDKTHFIDKMHGLKKFFNIKVKCLVEKQKITPSQIPRTQDEPKDINPVSNEATED